MKFDYIIGNPPYQEETESESTRKPPIYHFFMEQAYNLAPVVELITPARFLFNAGYTPKAWNEKMLSDTHLKVLFYEADADKVFPNKDIKGGVAITYRDTTQQFAPIEIFTKFNELNSILDKVRGTTHEWLSEIISSPLSYKVSPLLLEEHPDTVGRLRSSAFTALTEVFFESKPDDDNSYITMIGLLNGKRVSRYIRKDYIVDSAGILDKYTLLLAKANGNGQFGEQLSKPIIAEPGVGYLQTFIGVGAFASEEEAKNTTKYIYSKFARAMLGILKITQDCPGPKWRYVPLQDFTPASDIDWSKSVAEIDQQLYAKYGLDEKEIEFIETHVKEMA